DSALTAALAVEALGPQRVHCVSMPSRYSSAETRDDARRLTANLGADFRELPIDEIYNAFEAVLAASFAGREHDLTEDNLPARSCATTSWTRTRCRRTPRSTRCPPLTSRRTARPRS